VDTSSDRHRRLIGEKWASHFDSLINTFFDAARAQSGSAAQQGTHEERRTSYGVLIGTAPLPKNGD
jgi:hypothetical protein